MGELQNKKTRTIAGGAAGALTVTGIKKGDKLLTVVNVGAAGANLVAEFTITADDTIDNTGGTNTTGMILLVEWESFQGGRWEARQAVGRSSY